MNRNNRIGCLLLHGYSGSPFEMEYLGGKLRKMGYTVSIPCLPGHASSMEEFSRTRFGDWEEGAVEAYLNLEKQCDQVFVAGLSMGGSLGLLLAERFRPAGVMTMAAPVSLYRLFPFQGADWRLPLVGFLRFIRPLWPVPLPSTESLKIAPCQGYRGMQALHCLHSFMQGLKRVRKKLPVIQSPLLVLHAPGDRVCRVENSREIIRRAGSRHKSLELLPIMETVTSHHLLTTHIETRDRVVELCLAFIEKFRGSKEEFETAAHGMHPAR
ncbi:MAG: alpha/beta hydrolase [Desulfovibrionales bacterium]